MSFLVSFHLDSLELDGAILIIKKAENKLRTDVLVSDRHVNVGKEISDLLPSMDRKDLLPSMNRKETTFLSIVCSHRV